MQGRFYSRSVLHVSKNTRGQSSSSEVIWVREGLKAMINTSELLCWKQSVGLEQGSYLSDLCF